MFCNFCGKRIDPEKRVCPFCGQPQEPRTGGNGFWDILTPEANAEKNEPARPPQPPAPPVRSQPNPNSHKRKIGPERIIFSGIVLALLAGSIVLYAVSFSGMKKRLRQVDAALKEIDQHIAEMESEIASFDFPDGEDIAAAPTEAAAEPRETPSTAETNPAETEEAPAAASETPDDTTGSERPKARITAQLGLTGEKEFTIAYEADRAVWKYWADPEWKEIDPDDARFEIDDNTPGLSKLRIIAEDKDLYTKYMCTVIGADGGEEQSDAVPLIEKP